METTLQHYDLLWDKVRLEFSYSILEQAQNQPRRRGDAEENGCASRNVDDSHPSKPGPGLLGTPGFHPRKPTSGFPGPRGSTPRNTPTPPNQKQVCWGPRCRRVAPNEQKGNSKECPPLRGSFVHTKLPRTYPSARFARLGTYGATICRRWRDWCIGEPRFVD